MKFFEQALRKGDINIALKVIDEYNIPKDNINNTASKALISALDKSNYDEAFEILKKFKLDPKDAIIIEASHIVAVENESALS